MSSANVSDPSNADFDALRRQLRILVLLSAARDAGLVPMPLMRLHTFAYLTNVLAPVWDMPALEGKVLKSRRGPFYPALQEDIDRLVGRGIVRITGIEYIQEPTGSWALRGAYEINLAFAEPVLNYSSRFDIYKNIIDFARELALALAALSDSDFDRAMMEDATYSDPAIDLGSVVDFAEWRHRNFSLNGARHLKRMLPRNATVTPGEQLNFYVRHLHERLHARG